MRVQAQRRWGRQAAQALGRGASLIICGVGPTWGWLSLDSEKPSCSSDFFGSTWAVPGITAGDLRGDLGEPTAQDKPYFGICAGMVELRVQAYESRFEPSPGWWNG